MSIVGMCPRYLPSPAQFRVRKQLASETLLRVRVTTKIERWVLAVMGLNPRVRDLSNAEPQRVYIEGTSLCRRRRGPSRVSTHDRREQFETFPKALHALMIHIITTWRSWNMYRPYLTPSFPRYLIPQGRLSDVLTSWACRVCVASVAPDTK
jgi:hypothetical protein